MQTFELTPDQIEGRCLSHLTDHQLYVGALRQLADYIYDNRSILTNDQQASKGFAFLMQFRSGCFVPNCRELAEGKLIGEYFRTIILND